MPKVTRVHNPYGFELCSPPIAPTLLMSDLPEDFARDVAAIARIRAVPALLAYICQATDFGFAAVVRVTEAAWMPCAVDNRIGLDIRVGVALEASGTPCSQSRTLRQPVLFEYASRGDAWRNRRMLVDHALECYISMPIVRRNGKYFGSLCAMDRRPQIVSAPQTLPMFRVFADLIAMQLDSEELPIASDPVPMNAHTASDLREHFIAVLGHDLRNPLAAVGATAELLVRRREPEIARLGERLKTTARRMSNLIDDVLDFARGRLGAGIGVALEERHDMAGALHDVIEELRQAHPERDIAEHLAINRSLRCDRGRVQQLLSNLLGNAVTYGAADQPITVSATISNQWLVLTVGNEGAAIAPEDLLMVFQPYWRPQSSKPGGGLGLGLYICSEIARAHGGEMVVSSSAASGTLFSARLPVVVEG